MALGIALMLLAIAGIVRGTKEKNKLMVAGSVAGLIVVAAVWTFLFLNPY